jgi:hypothetical protein
MMIKLDKSLPDYQRKLARLRQIAAESGEPKGVFYFKTFDEFNDYKEILGRRLLEPDANDETSERR